MPFELIMLLGFFGTALLALLPGTPVSTAAATFRHEGQQRRSDRGQCPTTRHRRRAPRTTGSGGARRVYGRSAAAA